MNDALLHMSYCIPPQVCACLIHSLIRGEMNVQRSPPPRPLLHANQWLSKVCKNTPSLTTARNHNAPRKRVDLSAYYLHPIVSFPDELCDPPILDV